MKKLTLIVEKGEGKQLWGCVYIDDNLLSDGATSLDRLKKKLAKMVKEFHGIKPETISWSIAYDLSYVFRHYDVLNISAFAKMCNINSSLMRQYAAGVKYPSEGVVLKIEKGLQMLGKSLVSESLTVS